MSSCLRVRTRLSLFRFHLVLPLAVAREALADGIARVMPPAGALEDVFRDAMYEPEYVPLLNDVY